VLANKLPKGVLNANHLRKILDSNDRDALWAVEKAFGKIREERDPKREKSLLKWLLISVNTSVTRIAARRLSQSLRPMPHDLWRRRKVGPDITANGRSNFEQLLSNVFDPSLVIGPAYQVTTVVTKDGAISPA